MWLVDEAELVGVNVYDGLNRDGPVVGSSAMAELAEDTIQDQHRTT